MDRSVLDSLPGTQVTIQSIMNPYNSRQPRSQYPCTRLWVSKHKSLQNDTVSKIHPIRLQSDHGGENGRNEGTASAEAAERRSRVAGGGSDGGGGSSNGLDTESGASDDLS